MNNINSIDRDNPLWISEERIKNGVYSTFEKNRTKAKEKYDSNRNYVNDSNYESQTAFMSYRELDASKKSWRNIEGLIGKLYSKPYFSHISALLNGTEEEYFLSDNENLESIMLVGENGYLLPFKRDDKRPFLSKIFHCYQSRNGLPFEDLKGDIIEPTLICDDEINSGELLNVALLYSKYTPIQENIDADEVLVRKLQENRENPTLSNIISTLQYSQFSIIQDDVDADFAVQGCAGSGKSQVLLHRLFYLRDQLSDENWGKVLLITPTELFRSYSSELVRRYGLASIKNTSIAELYKSFLETFDSNFKNRQYIFEYTEEYLPDEYLREVYTIQNIQRIDSAIKTALNEHIIATCKLLKISFPDEYDAEYVKELVAKLDEKILNIDQLQKNEDESIDEKSVDEKRKKYIQDIELMKESIAGLAQKHHDKQQELEQFNKVYNNFIDIKDERSTWIVQRKRRILNVNNQLEEYESIDANNLTFDLPNKYSQVLSELRDLTEGDTYVHDCEYEAFLDEYYEQANSELMELCQKENPNTFKRKLNKGIKDISEVLNNKQTAFSELKGEYENFELKIVQRKTQKESITERKSLRSEYVRAKFFLQRIETAVFEKEVWNVLAPLKEKYDIKTINRGNGNKRIRILYKSDLLFYLRIYMRLYSRKVLPNYKLICVDEGQDLHAVEYMILRELFPDARFNIFGDTAQALHTNCGIHNWKNDTAVKKVYELKKNYRNAAAIVNFCNREFNSSMEYIGNPEGDSEPKKIENASEIAKLLRSEKVVVIVKNKKMFEKFCKDTEVPGAAFEFVDTNSAIVKTEKIKCYTIYAAKGLEFSKVIVYSREMTENQKVVACTRAMEKLYYYE